jgi:hypothetical protein
VAKQAARLASGRDSARGRAYRGFAYASPGRRKGPAWRRSQSRPNQGQAGWLSNLCATVPSLPNLRRDDCRHSAGSCHGRYGNCWRRNRRRAHLLAWCSKQASSGCTRRCDALARHPTKGLSRLRKYCVWADDPARGAQVAGGGAGVGRAVRPSRSRFPRNRLRCGRRRARPSAGISSRSSSASSPGGGSRSGSPSWTAPGSTARSRRSAAATSRSPNTIRARRAAGSPRSLRQSSSGAPMSGCLRAQSAVCSCMRSM